MPPGDGQLEGEKRTDEAPCQEGTWQFSTWHDAINIIDLYFIKFVDTAYSSLYCSLSTDASCL